MKKLLFIAVFSLVGFSGLAQETEEEMNIEKQEEVRTEVSEEVNAEDTATDMEMAGYTETAIEDLPGEVVAAVEKNHPFAKIQKAHWNEEKMIYRLDVTQEDSSPTVLYLDREGTFKDED